MSTPESGGAAPPAKKLAAADEDVLSVLFERWDVLAEDEDILPPLSPLASKLLAVEHEDAEAITELTQIVESDPVLTGRILGLANSVTIRARSKPIFEVVGAVIRLGVNAVFEAAFAQVAALWMRQNSQLPDPDTAARPLARISDHRFLRAPDRESCGRQQRQDFGRLRGGTAARCRHAGLERRASRTDVAFCACGLLLRHSAVRAFRRRTHCTGRGAAQTLGHPRGVIRRRCRTSCRVRHRAISRGRHHLRGRPSACTGAHACAREIQARRRGRAGLLRRRPGADRGCA